MEAHRLPCVVWNDDKASGFESVACSCLLYFLIHKVWVAGGFFCLSEWAAKPRVAWSGESESFSLPLFTVSSADRKGRQLRRLYFTYKPIVLPFSLTKSQGWKRQFWNLFWWSTHIIGSVDISSFVHNASLHWRSATLSFGRNYLLYG